MLNSRRRGDLHCSIHSLLLEPLLPTTRKSRINVICDPFRPSYQAGLEYATKLKAMADQHAGELVVVMRVYFEKPRTTVGWKGLINDPNMDGSYAINTGIQMARKFLLKINSLGLPCATEFLDTVSPQVPVTQPPILFLWSPRPSPYHTLTPFL